MSGPPSRRASAALGWCIAAARGRQRLVILALAAVITPVLAWDAGNWVGVWVRYGGVFAVIALLLNMVMMIGVLSFFGATLTLPGIAGILLTMGMAVDYNVLIFERIREEKKAGRSPITSVEAGYEHAMATIIDANVTHLVAALVMFNLGSGPVKGFALTLALGVLTSIFTAVVVARWIMSIWLKTFRPKWIPI